jgi:uncharacterized protein YbjT (DUF2867 family)
MYREPACYEGLSFFIGAPRLACESFVESNGQTAVLLGASGLIGGFCLHTLLADPSYTKIVLLVRRPLPISADARLLQKAISFDSLDANDFAGIGDVFCALGTTMRKAVSQEAFRRVDVEYPLTAAKMALQAGVGQFVLVSSVGADTASKSFYLRTKGELEREVGNLGFARAHIFRPSLLLGRRDEFRLGEGVMQAMAPVLNLAMIGGWRRYRPISAAAVGRAMVAAARQGSKGTSIYEYDEIIRFAS